MRIGNKHHDKFTNHRLANKSDRPHHKLGNKLRTVTRTGGSIFGANRLDEMTGIPIVAKDSMSFQMHHKKLRGDLERR